MFHSKNLPAWERALRVVAGLASGAFAAMNWGGSSLAVGAGVAGAVFAVTGLVGFCPMCALAGRRLAPKR